MNTTIGLCHRCEHRVVFLEEGHAPRCECKDSGCVASCYMYMPVRPVIQKRNDGDNRPVTGPSVINARSHGIRLLDNMILRVFDNNTYVKYYMPNIEYDPFGLVDENIDINEYKDYVSERLNEWDITELLDFIWELLEGSVNVPEWIAGWQASYCEGDNE